MRNVLALLIVSLGLAAGSGCCCSCLAPATAYPATTCPAPTAAPHCCLGCTCFQNFCHFEDWKMQKLFGCATPAPFTPAPVVTAPPVYTSPAVCPAPCATAAPYVQAPVAVSPQSAACTPAPYMTTPLSAGAGSPAINMPCSPAPICAPIPACQPCPCSNPCQSPCTVSDPCSDNCGDPCTTTSAPVLMSPSPGVMTVPGATVPAVIGPTPAPANPAGGATTAPSL